MDQGDERSTASTSPDLTVMPTAEGALTTGAPFVYLTRRRRAAPAVTGRSEHGRMPLWIPITVAAALFQCWRTAMQQKLRHLLSVNGAGFVRFLYGAPDRAGAAVARADRHRAAAAGAQRRGSCCTAPPAG